MGEQSHEPERTGHDRVGRAAVWIAAIGGGWLFAKQVIEPPTEHEPGAVAAVLVGGVLLGVGFFYAQDWLMWRRRAKWSKMRQAEYEEGITESAPRPDYEPNRAWVGPAIAFAVVVALVGWQAGSAIRSHEITYYCSYGTVSRAQVAECEERVSSSYIDSLHTNAARFARGELEECLGDSGPFCTQEKTYMEEEAEAPRPGE
jgi:hypothetical protein